MFGKNVQCNMFAHVNCLITSAYNQFTKCFIFLMGPEWNNVLKLLNN